MLVKSLLLKKRDCLATSLEILIPFLFVWVLVALRGVIKIRDQDAIYYPPTDLSEVNQYGAISLMTALKLKSAKVALVAPTELNAIEFMTYLNTNVFLDFEATPPSPLLTSSNYTIFKTNQDFTDYMKSDSYMTPGTPMMEFGVVFSSFGPTTWSYTLRLNSSDSDGPMSLRAPDVLFRDKGAVDNFQREYDNSSELIYQNGFLFLQQTVDSFILSKEAAAASVAAPTPPLLWSMPFPTKAYRIDTFNTLVGVFLGLLYCLAYLLPLARTVKLMVNEKETRVAEGMQIMGLSSVGLWLSWFITYALVYFVTAVLITVCSSGSIFKNTSAGMVLLLFWLYGLSCFAAAFVFSALFSTAQRAVVFCLVLFLIGFFGFFVLDAQSTAGQRFLAGFHPSINLAMAAQVIGRFEETQNRLDYSTWDTSYNNFSVQDAVGLFIRNIIVYIAFGVYLNLVVPGEYGARLKPWFCCDPRSAWPSETNDTRTLLRPSVGLSLSVWVAGS